jgi:hypothetical protein
LVDIVTNAVWFAPPILQQHKVTNPSWDQRRRPAPPRERVATAFDREIAQRATEMVLLGDPREGYLR